MATGSSSKYVAWRSCPLQPEWEALIHAQYTLKALTYHVFGHEAIQRVLKFLSSAGSRPTARS